MLLDAVVRHLLRWSIKIESIIVRERINDFF